ncbi:retrovirus-related pol polyprotein from transposon TNT 1-94 [Tanacetum coccineum]
MEYPPSVDQQSEFSQQESGLIVPVFQKGDDPIDAINHMMSFLTAVVTSCYPTTNNQLRNSSNPRQQATINNGRVTLQPIQGRQTSVAAGTSKDIYSCEQVELFGKKQRTVICYNCKGEGHMSKQCTKLKRKRDDSWFKDKSCLLVSSSSKWSNLMRRELAFLQIGNFSKDALLRYTIMIFSDRPTNVEVPKELPKVSMLNTSLKKLKYHLANFDVCLKLETELQKDFVEKEIYDKLFKRFTTLEIPMHFVVEVDTQLNQGNFFKGTIRFQIQSAQEKVLGNYNSQGDELRQEAAVLRDLVDHIKANFPLDPTLESALKPSTSASGSQPSGNTKKDKIQQTQSSTQKNKVESHPRKVKSSLKNKDHVVAPKGTARVQHSKLNSNYELKCVKCNGCMLSDNHDLCVLDYINNVNARAKS